MQTFVGVLVLSLALAASALPYTSRVVGGSDAPEGKYPYQVSLWNNGKFHCGGSIVNDVYVLTAAHCLFGVNAEQVRVGVGSRFLNETVDLYPVRRLVPHYGFNPLVLHNDIGLVRLAMKIVFGDKVKPIPMAVQDFSRANSTAVLTGWGKLYVGGPGPNCLQEVELRIAEQKECENIKGGRWPVGSKQICTFTKRGEGACNGDSGGPLVVDGYQIGIVSWGRPCARGVPDVFTRVHSYLGWMEETITDDL